jgi:hypothetical protein
VVSYPSRKPFLDADDYQYYRCISLPLPIKIENNNHSCWLTSVVTHIISKNSLLKTDSNSKGEKVDLGAS